MYRFCILRDDFYSSTFLLNKYEFVRFQVFEVFYSLKYELI